MLLKQLKRMLLIYFPKNTKELLVRTLRNGWIIYFKKYKIIIEEFDKREDKCLTGYDEILINKLSLGPKQIDRFICRSIW